MSDFRFEQPQWIHLLWGIALLSALLLWLELRSTSALNRFLSETMQLRLVQKTSRLRRLMALALLVVALISLTLAVMRPQWGATPRVLPRVGAQIMVCLDVSKSMLAEDTVPNRLERAKAELGDLLDLLRGEQVGLIAFAGKASVISPLTTDFGFLKLLLKELGPHNVGRGGTRLEEPIRQALEGFGTAADISRVILLITDGEDQDSFPLDAADAAREQGVKIITIGFGDETGSKIQVTDPRTGVRSFVMDPSGIPAISRLDGETLREIALRTDGAYIPAGTGALDLGSIHRQHITPLMRGDLPSSEQVLRNEAFQWAVLGGLVFLCSSLFVDRGGPRSAAGDDHGVPPALRVGLLCWALVTASAVQAEAQTEPAPTEASADKTTGATASAEPDSGLQENGLEQAADVDPRAVYNQSLDLLATSADEARNLLTRARRNAGADGEVRFRSAYNLAWVEIHQANTLIEEQPEEALKHLHEAADWFRESIRLRPKDLDARHNLEIVMRRSLELADSLAAKDSRDVTAKLDDLIQQQRALVAQTANLVERLAAETAAPPDSETYRRDFRTVATGQRQILSDGQALAQQIAEELGGLQQVAAEEQDDRQRLRAAQLQGTAYYLQRATQRLGQTRSQLRRRDADRGFRRASLGLDELKRARDMLRAPAEILQRLITDTQTLRRQTTTIADAASDVTGGRRQQVPFWLTPELLEQSQQDLLERTRQLADQMQSVLKQDAAAATASAPPKPTDDETGDNELQRDRHRQASEWVGAAADAFEMAQAAMVAKQLDSASEQQTVALQKLVAAHELFLDLRGLIELASATQNQLNQMAQALPDLEPTRQTDVAQAALDGQRKNLDRAQRIADQLRQEQIRLDAEQAQPPGPPTMDPAEAAPPTEQAAARQRLQLAEKLLGEAQQRMQNAASDFNDWRPSTDRGEPGDATGPDPPEENPPAEEPEIDSPAAQLQEHVQAAVDRLEELRRLYFSIVDHLRETAQRQSDVNDETQKLAAENDAQEKRQNLGPLADAQQEVQETARQIAATLEQQANQTPPDSAEQQQQQQQQQQLTQKLREAAGHVQQATTQMGQALQEMRDDPPKIPSMAEPHERALDELQQALALLVPPQQNGEDEQQQQQNEGQNPEQDSAAGQQQEQQQNMNVNQLLQLIRDRDAQRRRDKARQTRMAPEPVEKDW